MESISRISSLLETARDLTLEAARDAGPRKSSRPLPAAQIKKLLDSKHEREVLDGLRRVIAMQYASPPQPTLTYFPAVLKTLSNPYSSTRPLVYNYLLHHAEADPDTALLAINTIQKSLSDSNPRVRAMALKTMSGIRVPVISQIVSLAIKKGIGDMSPLVRKAAALACVKCIRLDSSTKPQVEEYIAALLGDKQYYVVGAAVQAFVEICPERLDLIHPVYRSLAKKLVDMDEWGQLATLRLLTFYCRRCFPQRSKRVKRAAITLEDKQKGFYDDEANEEGEMAEYDEITVTDPDMVLLLTSAKPLLQSRNSAVILSVTRLYLYLSPSNHLPSAIGPLVALLRSPDDIRHLALHNIVQVCLLTPTSFVPHFRHFLIRSTEAAQTWRLKLEILTLIFPHCGTEIQELILAELEHFSHGHNVPLVRESVRAIGRCAQSSDEKTSRRCLHLLLKQMKSPDSNLVGESIEVIRHLIQRAPQEHRKTVIRLAKNLDTSTSSMARASIIWLVGEFAGMEPEDNVAADVLRLLVRGYVDEADEVRTQIVFLAAKVYLHHVNGMNTKRKALEALGPPKPERQSSGVLSPTEDQDGGFGDDPFGRSASGNAPSRDDGDDVKHPIALLYHHVLLLARYTPSYDLRDRARLFRALLALSSSTELASLLLLAPKPVPQAPSPSKSRRGFTLGSASLIIGGEAGVNGLKGYEAMPDWVEDGHEPDPKLRDDGEKADYGESKAAVSAGQMLDRALEANTGYESNGGAGKGKNEKTLDDWLDEEDDGEEEGTEDETEASSEESEEDSEEESESEGDEKAGLVR